MLKKEWFTEENIKKFVGKHISNIESNTLPAYIRIARDSDVKQIGDSKGIPYYMNLITELTQYNDISLRRKEKSKFLFLFDYTQNGNSHFRINKEFDWDSYYKDKQIKEHPNENEEELTLLKSIATMLNKEFREPNGLFKHTLPSNIASAMTIWNEKYNNQK